MFQDSIGARLRQFIDARNPAREEERARERGLQVVRKPFGKRAYRDPRFDALKALASVQSAPDDDSTVETTADPVEEPTGETRRLPATAEPSAGWLGGA